MIEHAYKWLPGSMVTNGLLQECADLYSNHYGKWSVSAPKTPNKNISLSPDRIRKLLEPDSSNIALAYYEGKLVGYAISLRMNEPKYGMISWVTQLVVHFEHRNLGVGTSLLFSCWCFSNHFAWGLLTANPFAVRALEKATRRRCIPKRILKNWKKLSNIGVREVPYMTQDVVISQDESRINTHFFVDHSEVKEMLSKVTQNTPWSLGDIDEGWEWFAFTFNDQEQIGLSLDETRKLIETSDQIAKYAYSLMKIEEPHAWAQHAEYEVSRVIEYCGLQPEMNILDFGCGSGRHISNLARKGIYCTGVDFNKNLLKLNLSSPQNSGHINFVEGDCRYINLDKQYDSVICLYDVVGTYASDAENEKIIKNIYEHLLPNGFALISVMNYELTVANAKHTFSFNSNPDTLLSLNASNIMETTGNIFNPDYYMVDTDTKVVYRKEQFTPKHGLPVELIVRDRRYAKSEIEEMCSDVGLEIIWTRYVSAGKWETQLNATDKGAKEILVLCKKTINT